jgi:hypothetical protein
VWWDDNRGGGQYKNRKVPANDKNVVDETAIPPPPAINYGYDDDNGCFGGSKDSVEKVEIKYAAADKSFTCNGTESTFYEEMLLSRAERIRIGGLNTYVMYHTYHPHVISSLL